jgi:hypothetical protein
LLGLLFDWKGLVPWLLLPGCPELLSGLLKGLPRLVEVVGDGVVKLVLGCCCAGPAVAEPLQRPN